MFGIVILPMLNVVAGLSGEGCKFGFELPAARFDVDTQGLILETINLDRDANRAALWRCHLRRLCLMPSCGEIETEVGPVELARQMRAGSKMGGPLGPSCLHDSRAVEHCVFSVYLCLFYVLI
ncbi:MAG: hypothetical protein E5Y58_02955 [Mesorhizobium sp.]|nr:MAG: hypothetical protein E5Y58_02955 [Mesorhizobium sp.]